MDYCDKYVMHTEMYGCLALEIPFISDPKCLIIHRQLFNYSCYWFLTSSPPLPAPFSAHPFPFQPTAILDPWTPHISSLPSQTHSHNYPSLLHPTNNHAISTTLFETITLCLLMDLLTTCTAIQWTTIRTTITTPIPSRYEHYTHPMQTGYPQMLQNLRGGYKLALLDTLT